MGLDPRPAGRHPLASLLDVLGTLSALAQTRLELLATEVEQEKRRVLSVLAWMLVAVLLGCFGLLFLALLITAALWESHPFWALGLSALCFAGGALWAAWQARQRLSREEGMLDASLAEFEGDREALQAAADDLRRATSSSPSVGGVHAQ